MQDIASPVSRDAILSINRWEWALVRLTVLVDMTHVLIMPHFMPSQGLFLSASQTPAATERRTD